MKLERFQLQGFAQHQYIDLRFRDGVPNLIIGPNEAGKSNLMDALLGTLYGISDPDPYVPWHDDPIMTGRLRFIADQDVVELERRFKDDHVEARVNEETVYSGRGLVSGRSNEDDRYRQLLHEWIGFAEPDVFERTVFVGQDLLHDQKLSDFSAKIKQLISGTQEANYETAISDLYEELRNLRLSGRDRNPRLLEIRKKEMADLEERHRQAEDVQSRAVKLVEEEKQLQEQIDEVSSAQQRFKTLVDRYGAYQRLQETEERARREWRDLDGRLESMNSARQRRGELERRREELQIPGDPEPETIRTIINEMARLKERIEHLEGQAQARVQAESTRKELREKLDSLRIPGEPDPSELQQLGLRIEHLEEQVESLNRRIQEARDAPASGPEDRSQPAMSSTVRGILILTSVALGLSSVALGLLIDPLILVMLVIAVVPLLVALFAGRGQPGQTTDEPERGTNAERIAELQGDLAARERELSELIEKRDESLQATGLKTLEQVLERANDYERTRLRLEAHAELDADAVEMLADARVKLKDLDDQGYELLVASAEQDLETLYTRANEFQQVENTLRQLEKVDEDDLRETKERLDKAQQDAAIAAQQKDALLEKHPELAEIQAERVEEYRKLVNEAESKQESAEDRLRQVRFERQTLAQGSEDAEAMRLEINELRTEIERIALQADAHELAIQVLRDSVAAFQENALDPVAKDATGYFGSITNGRYQSVTIERDTMTPIVSGNGQGKIEFDILSRGAKDQLYLSIRAALVDALSGDRQLPLILDDPCVHFDDGRLEAAAELIGELAQERQILLFTKDETWTKWFVPVLRLERRDSVVRR